MNELIQRMYASDEDDKRKVLQELMNWIFNQLRSGDINQLNSLYNSLDVTKLSLLFMAGVLRPSSSYRQHLPAWEPFRLRAIEEAKVRFPDTWRGAFHGMIDMKEYGMTGTEGAFDRLLGIHPTIARK